MFQRHKKSLELDVETVSMEDGHWRYENEQSNSRSPWKRKDAMSQDVRLDVSITILYYPQLLMYLF